MVTEKNEFYLLLHDKLDYDYINYSHGSILC